MEVVQRHLDQLAVNKQELETVHERLRVAQTGIAAAETRVEAVSAREQGLAQLGDRIESSSTGLQELTAQADTLQRKQTALSTLEERLDGLEATAKRTQWQFDGLAEQRKDLDDAQRTRFRRSTPPMSRRRRCSTSFAPTSARWSSSWTRPAASWGRLAD